MADARVPFSVAHCDKVLCKIKCINKLACFLGVFFFFGGGGGFLYIPSALCNIVGLLIFEVTPYPQLAKETNILENKQYCTYKSPRDSKFCNITSPLPKQCLS